MAHRYTVQCYTDKMYTVRCTEANCSKPMKSELQKKTTKELECQLLDENSNSKAEQVTVSLKALLLRDEQADLYSPSPKDLRCLNTVCARSTISVRSCTADVNQRAHKALRKTNMAPVLKPHFFSGLQ